VIITGLILAHAKFRLQNHDDELAGRKVVIDQNDFVETETFGLYLIFDRGRGGDVVHGRIAPEWGEKRPRANRARGRMRTRHTSGRCRTRSILP
jgi:hypothetical protein